MISARSGMLSTSSRMRFSNLMTPTVPTFRPKLRTYKSRRQSVPLNRLCPAI